MRFGRANANVEIGDCETAVDFSTIIVAGASVNEGKIVGATSTDFWIDGFSTEEKPNSLHSRKAVNPKIGRRRSYDLTFVDRRACDNS